ncbi:helix-hairpin-helix domain-containing protein [Staphylococcus aureus]
MIYDIKGIGFNKADQLARNIGIAYNDNERLKAALLYTLEEECIKQVHTYLPINVVIDLTVDVLNYQDEEVIEPEKLDEMLQYLNEEKRLIIDNEQVAF